MERITIKRHEYAQTILDAMYQFLGLLDTDGNVLEINRAALEGAGIKLDDVIGKPFWETHWWAISEKNRAIVREMVAQAKQGQFVRRDIDVYGDMRGSGKIFVDFSLTPIRDKNGLVKFLLPEGRNITEKIEMEAELKQKNEQLELTLQKLRDLDGYKTKFFANVSHDLRTPLTLILGSVDQMLRNVNAFSEGDAQRLKTLKLNAQVLIQEVNDLLDLARMDAEQMPLVYTSVNIVKIIKNIVATFASLAEEKSIQVLVEGDESFAADVDQVKLIRIIGNLLSNAFKFTPRGGRICCSVREVQSNRFIVEIEDSGPGIPQIKREHVFSRFSQGSEELSDIGTGIGLNIVKEFVELQGGTVNIVDAPTGGTIFRVILPSYSVGSVISRARSANEISFVPRVFDASLADIVSRDDLPGLPTILVVEDNDILRGFLFKTLIDQYNVHLAANGLEALEKIAKTSYDLIVTDLMMPGLDGESFIRGLRENAGSNSIPVVVLSARADDRLRETLLDGLVQDYVTKPFSATELKARIHNLVSIKSTVSLLQRELNSHASDIGELTNDLLRSRKSLQDTVSSLMRSEQRWDGLYQNTRVGIALADIHGKVIKANPALQNMLGYGENEIVGVSFIDITEHQLKEETRYNVNNVFDGSISSYHIEKRYKRKNGTYLWAAVSASMIPAVEQEGPRLAVLVEDITSKKESEMKLASTQAELAHVARYTSMGELVATIAHEVNQPLSAILTNGQAALRWLTREEPDYQEVADALKRVNRDANVAGNVIARVRNFISKGEMNFGKVDIRLVLDDLKILLQAVLFESNVGLVCDVDPMVPDFQADYVQLQQVLLNLMVNAIDAMREHGYGLRVLTVYVTYDSSLGIVFTISDTGPGIAEKNQDKIFDVLFSTKAQGLGMGLAICRTIVESHGGKIYLGPDQDIGTKIVFHIPFVQ